jgi:hypothetical protein
VRTLAALGYTSLMLIALGACGSAPGTRLGGGMPSSASGTATASSKPSLTALSVGDVLAWRGIYRDLLGKPREAVIERFGPPNEDQNSNSLSWQPSQKTADRQVSVLFDSAVKGGVAQAVKAFARPTESLDPMEVLKKAPMFKFETGTYTDSLLNYFVAQTKDERNAFQFDVAESGVKFRAMVFTQK